MNSKTKPKMLPFKIFKNDPKVDGLNKSVLLKKGDDPTIDLIVLETVYVLDQLVKPYFNFFDLVYFSTSSSNKNKTDEFKTESASFSGIKSSPFHSFLTSYEIIPLKMKEKCYYGVHEWVDNTRNFETDSIEKAFKNQTANYFTPNLLRTLSIFFLLIIVFSILFLRWVWISLCFRKSCR
jgi:hypothetical protein